MKPIKINLITNALIVFFVFFSFKKIEAKEEQIKSFIIGTTPGDFADMAREGIKPELEKKGYKVKVVEFSDYVTPNIALSEGQIDVNIFQHKPYLDQFITEKKLQLTAIVQVPTAPLGLYAGQLKSISEVHQKSIIAIPNDPTNLSRALVILSDLGWIEMVKGFNPLLAGLKDISKNPKNLKIVLLEAAQLPRALGDVDFAIINGNYATSSGLSLTSALAREKSDSYINWAVVQEKNIKASSTKDLIEVLNSTAFKNYSKKKFKGYQFPRQWN